mgnify:CR=1 FL=1
MTFANLVRVHSRIARRQKALWYTSIPLTLFAVLVSFGGGRAPHTGGVEDIVYTAQIVAIFVGVAYAAAFTDLLAAQGEPESQAYIRAATACQTLLAPQEMGELFKVIAFGRNIDPDWPGFALGDLCHKL